MLLVLWAGCQAPPDDRRGRVEVADTLVWTVAPAGRTLVLQAGTGSIVVRTAPGDSARLQAVRTARGFSAASARQRLPEVAAVEDADIVQRIAPTPQPPGTAVHFAATVPPGTALFLRLERGPVTATGALRLVEASSGDGPVTVEGD